MPDDDLSRYSEYPGLRMTMLNQENFEEEDEKQVKKYKQLIKSVNLE